MKKNIVKRLIALACTGALLISDMPVAARASDSIVQYENEASDYVVESERQVVSESLTDIDSVNAEDMEMANASAYFKSTGDNPETEENDGVENVPEIQHDYYDESNSFKDSAYDNEYEPEELYAEESGYYSENLLGIADTENVQFEIRKYDYSVSDYVSVGDEKLLLKGEPVTLSYGVLSDPIAIEDIFWESSNDLVTIEPAFEGSSDVVTVLPRKGIPGGDDTVTANVTYYDESDIVSVQLSVEIEVWTGRDVSLSTEVSYADGRSAETSEVEVGDSIAACLTANPVMAPADDTGGVETDPVVNSGEADPSQYVFQWEKLDESDPDGLLYNAVSNENQIVFTPTIRGTYRLCATSVEDIDTKRISETWYSDPITVEPIRVNIELPIQERTYNGSGLFAYDQEAVVTREGTGSVIDSLSITCVTDMKIGNGDAGTYTGSLTLMQSETDFQYDITDTEGNGYGSLTLDLDPEVYSIESISNVTVVIQPAVLNARITAKDKFFDNTARLSEMPEIIWESPEETEDIEVPDGAGLLIGSGENWREISADDFIYSSVGKVDEDTEVSLQQADQNMDIMVGLAGVPSDNYSAQITYDNAIIKMVSVPDDIPAEAVSVEGDYTEKVDGGKSILWFKADEKNEALATVKAMQGYTVSGELDGTYAETAEVSISDENKATAYVKNEKGEIAGIVLDNLHKDGTAPTVTLQNTKKFIFDRKNITETYSVSDLESGIAGIYYLVTEEKQDVKFDENTWEKVETSIAEDGNCVIDIKMPKYGYVYICVIDNVGNLSVDEQYLLVLEDAAPEKPEITFKTENTKPLTKQSVNIKVKDTGDKKGISGIQAVEYQLLDKEKKDVTADADISVITIEGSGLKQTDNIITRENIPENIEQIRQALSMEAELSISSDGSLNGEYLLIITAYDYCGNESISKEKVFFDGNGPRASISKDDAREAYDGNYYYKADNCGFNVIFEDDNISDGGTYKVIAESSAAVQIVSKELEEKDISGTKGIITFTAADIAALADGDITITVEAKDYAGNEFQKLRIVKASATSNGDSDSDVSGDKTALDGISVNGKQARFVLDKKAPELVRAVTQSSGFVSPGAGDGIIAYGSAFETIVTINDEHIGTQTLKAGLMDPAGTGTFIEQGDGFKVSADASKDGVAITYSIYAQGLYGEFVIIGTDYAGNALVVAQDKNDVQYDKRDEWLQKNDSFGNPEGGIARYRKEYEGDGITAEISYYKHKEEIGGKTTEELLEERYQETGNGRVGPKKGGYYNSTAAIEVVFANLAESRLSQISVLVTTDENNASYSTLKDILDKGINSTENGVRIKADISKKDDSSYTLRYILEDEGEYRIFIKGTNASGKPITVVENDVSGKEEGRYSNSNINEGNPYQAQNLIIVDKTSPVLSIVDIAALNASNQELNEVYGNRYYFNSDYIATFVIKEKHLDKNAEKVNIWRAHKKTVSNTMTETFDKQDQFVKGGTEINSKRIFLDTDQGVSFDEKNAQAIFTDPIRQPEDVSEEGIYRYLFYGEDAAGNPLLVKKNLKNIETTMDVTDADFPNATEGYLSNVIAVDRTSPVGMVKISNEKDAEPFYEQKGFDVLNPMQYISSDKAYITVSDDRSKAGNNGNAGSTGDRTPYKISYTVNLKNGVNKEKHVEDGYAYAQESTYEVKGRQIFSISDIMLVDLAGNVSVSVPGTDAAVYPSTSSIYLDQDIESGEDSLAPSVGIVPSGDIFTDTYGNQGQPLFNASKPITFDVKISDPYGSSSEKKPENRSSSGLAKVEYAVYGTENLSAADIGEKVKIADFSGLTLLSEGGSWKPNPIFTGSSVEAELVDVYEQEKAITIPGDVNRNDIMVLVTAEDNAGNVKRAYYLFGIDGSTPEITIEYDNNEVKNGKYFNSSRKAILTVRDRNFDPDYVNMIVNGVQDGNYDPSHNSIVLEGDAAGMDTEKAGQFKTSGWKFTQGTEANGDDDRWIYTAEFPNDGLFGIHIYSADGQENILQDRAGNIGAVNTEAQTSPYEFVIDTQAPEITVRMGGSPDKEDGHYYYRADNCGINVTYSDQGYNLAAIVSDGDSTPGTRIYTSNIDGKEEKAFISGSESMVSVELSYTADEVAKFKDGSHSVNVRAVDLAGNEATTVFISKDMNKTSRGCEFKGTSGSFILDKTPPKVTSIRTAPVLNLDKAETDNQVYADTKNVYYNRNVNVILAVEDEYVKLADYENGVTKNAFVQEKASVEKTKSGITFTYKLMADNAYTKLYVRGEDKAGNLLVLAGDYWHNTVSSVDELTDDGKGRITALYGKVIDTKNPVVRISYVSADNANLYTDEIKNRVAAYYNKNITVQYRMTDNYELDGKKIKAGQANAAVNSKWALTNPAIPRASESASRDYKGLSYPVTTEGRYSFTVFGMDRALNPVQVQEMIPRTDSNPTDTYEKDVEAKDGFTSKYVLVLDKTKPVFKLLLNSPSATNQSKNSQGNRYYFNSGYTAELTIKETNFDYRRIVFKRGEVINGEYNSETTLITRYPILISGTVKIMRDKINTDGVYRYAIYGSDKAGNALEAESYSYLDGKDGAVVDVGAEKSRGSNEKSANISNHVVVDTVSPAGQMSISNGQTAYYTMLTNGNVTYAEPYRQEQAADILFTVDTGVERSPVRMTYSVESTISGQSQDGDTQDYKYARNLSISQNGRQQFKVTSYTVTDLAGNEVRTSSDNFIYLDMEPPTEDNLAPTIQVVTTAPSGVRSGAGQPLFNTSVPINIVVTDPYGGISSSGLAEIQYDMYVNGALVGGDTMMLHGPNTKSFTQNYQDENLDYQYNETVTVDAGSHNFNDLRVVITAADNSGNSSMAEYSFGIDVSSPSISVFYDNNNAQNGKYFKEDRTATVVVTERNFDPSKINIQTESTASISGWSHSAGGSANGDDDTWTALISYTTDGEYHLAISGSDLLGNAASETRYDGVAPTDFILDKTAPLVTVTYDNNDVRNGRYYKADRTATITVEDVNFDGTHNIEIKADAKDKAPGVIFNGKTSTLPFDKDGIYQIGGTVTDMAGNVSRPIEDPEFVLDKTLPKLMIEGVKNLSANRKPIGIILTMLDTNVNEACIQVAIKGTNNGNMEIGGKPEMLNNGVKYTVDVIDKDDYYTLVFTGTDLAGNEVVQKISFSENQHGTVFVFEQKEIEGKYTNKTFNPSFKLYNVDEVTILSVTLNGREVSYTYEEDRLVLRDKLKSDGKYVITIDTEDAAGNINSMEPVEFYIDRTKPVLTVTGIDKKQKYYFEEFDLRLIHDNPLDEFEKIVLDGKTLGKDEYILGKDGSVTIHIDEYGEHELSVVVQDAAGNINDEEKYEFVLTRNPVIRWYSSKPLFFGSLAAVSALIVAFVIFLWKRRKEKEADR